MNLEVCDNDEIAPYLRGCYLGTYGFIDLSSLSYIVESQYSRFRTNITNLKYVYVAVKANIILDGYTTNTANYFDSHSTEDLQITTDNNTNILYIRNLSCSTADELKSALSGKILLYELKTPSTPVITSTDYANILTSFNANGQTYTVSFGQTVYGGVLDVTRGKLTVTHGKYTLNDVSDLSRNSDHSFYFGATPAPKATGTAYYVGVMSDKFMPGETANQDVIFIHPNGFVRFNTANAYQSTSDCFTAIGEITVVYPLETPFDIDLTPEVIEAIVGTNNVFADCGQTTVKYLKAGA